MTDISLPDLTRRAAVYCRVSGRSQKDGFSLQAQETAARAYAEKHGMQIVVTFSEVYTSTTLDRPKFGRVLDLAERGLIDTVVVAVSDRLGRGSKFEAALDMLRAYDVEVHHVGRGIISDDDDDSVYLQNSAEAMVSRIELRNNRTRMKSGKVTKTVERGLLLAAGHAPYGYRYIGHGRERTLEVDKPTAAVVRTIFDLYVSGIGVKAISRYLGEHNIGVPASHMPYVHRQAEGRTTTQWPTQTIYKILRRRAYIGEWEAFGRNGRHKEAPGKKPIIPVSEDVVMIACPAIVARSIWEQAQARLATGKQLSPRNNTRHFYLLRGTVYCVCGRKMAAMDTGATHYRCSRNQDPKHRRIVTEHCPNRSKRFSVATVDAAVWAWIRAEVLIEANILAAIERTEEGYDTKRERLLIEKHSYETRLHANREALDRLKAAVVSGVFIAKDLAVDKQRINGEYNELMVDIVEVDQKLAGLGMTLEMRNFIVAEARRLANSEAHATPQEQHIIVEALQTRVELYQRDGQPWAHVEVRFTIPPYQATDLPLHPG